MISKSSDGKQRVLSLSYGKDSMACLGAIEELGLPLDRIITADVWATDTIPADLPPMNDFKEYADQIILERYGIKVEHFRSKDTYEGCLLRMALPETLERRKRKGTYEKLGLIWGFPTIRGPWCNKHLKMAAIDMAKKSCEGAVSYIGIAADETSRIDRHKDKAGVAMPLVAVGWTENDAWKWSEEHGLLSPLYKTSKRGGCWFCHNQGLDQLRQLRKDYPELWEKLLIWDDVSPVRWSPHGQTVHDYDRRFQLEDEGLLFPDDKKFRWSWLDEALNYRWF